MSRALLIMEYRTLDTVLNLSHQCTKPVKTIHLHLSKIPSSVIDVSSGVCTAPGLLQNHATCLWSITLPRKLIFMYILYIKYMFLCCRITSICCTYWCHFYSSPPSRNFTDDLSEVKWLDAVKKQFSFKKLPGQSREMLPDFISAVCSILLYRRWA